MLKLATKFAPRPTAASNATGAGFQWAELFLDEDILANWQETATLARSAPLGFALHFPNRLHRPEVALDQAVSLYRALDCRCMVIHQPLFDRHSADLLRRCPEMRLAVENHNLTPERLVQWAEHNPGLALDVEHLWKYTLHDAPLERLLDGLRQFLSQFSHKLRHVHLPGYLPGYAEHRPMYCAREMVFGCFALLAEYHFEGLVVSEANPEYQNPTELQMDVLLYQAWQERHGTALAVAGGHGTP
jgi:hypothetical protein